MTAAAGTIPAVVTARTPYPQAAKALLRETLFGAARDELQNRAWSETTMSDIAAAAGVSRQTLYKEFGSRDEFGQAFVIHEGERFLDAVEAAIKRAPRRPPRGASAPPWSSSSAPPARTPRPHPAQRRRHRRHAALRHHPGHAVVQWATARLAAAIQEGWPQAPEADTHLLAESLVRLAISYVTAPSGPQSKPPPPQAGLLGPFLDTALGTSLR